MSKPCKFEQIIGKRFVANPSTCTPVLIKSATMYSGIVEAEIDPGQALKSVDVLIKDVGVGAVVHANIAGKDHSERPTRKFRVANATGTNGVWVAALDPRQRILVAQGLVSEFGPRKIIIKEENGVGRTEESVHSDETKNELARLAKLLAETIVEEVEA